MIFSEVLEQIKRALNIEEMQRAIVNNATREVKNEILSSAHVLGRVDTILSKCEKQLHNRVNQKITAQIKELDFKIMFEK